MIQTDGTIRRVERKTILGTKSKDDLSTEKLAKRKAALVLARVNRPDYRPSKIATLAEFVEDWKADALSVMKPSTRKAAESHLRCHLLPNLGKLKLEQITQEDVQALVARIAPQLSRHTILNVLATFSSILTTARRWGYLVGDVKFSELKIPAGRLNPKKRFFSAAEATAIIRAASEPWRTVFAVAALTALRPGEVLGLAVDDLDFENKVIYVRQSAYYSMLLTPKNDRVGTVPMPGPLERILREYLTRWKPNPNRLLFATRNGTPDAENKVVQRKLWPILDRLSIPRCGMHAFRHTHTSLLIATGASPVVAQTQLRHRDPLTTLRNYAHLLGDEQRSAAERVAAILWPENSEILRPDAAKLETKLLVVH